MPINATPGPALTPSSVKTQSRTNYISFFDYSSQFLPDEHDEIAQIYGNQSISGMLYMMGAESSFASDQVIWTEEGRLHTVYTTVARATNVFTQANHVFRLNETVHISDASNKRMGVITAVDNDTFTVAPYKSAGFTALGTTGLTVFVTGSEHFKGSGGQQGSLETDFSIQQNKPIILKDRFEVNGSDATQIGWVKTDMGGYLWYMQSEMDTRERWEDRLELSMILGELAEDGSVAQQNGYEGTEGLFEAVRTRGNTFQGLADQLTEWDDILKRFDAQGKIKDYMFYVDRDQSLAIDNLLGTLNAGYSGGISYGIFENGEDMAVNLGFLGFRRGTYNFFKSDWKLLNDPTLLGAVAAGANKVRGLLVPVGSTSVYEGAYNGRGDNSKVRVPYLQLKYRMAGSEQRRYKTWLTGSVNGVSNNEDDVMTTHHLSERLLCTVGANNFMIFEGA